MEEKEYLQTLGEQILNPHARTQVLEEIQEHIDEQMQDYIDTGMSPDAAEKEAVRQMGDPVAAGTELNRIHRPRFPGVLFGIAVVLTLSGIFMQYILYGSEPLNTTYSNTAFMQHAVFYQMIGFGIILFRDIDDTAETCRFDLFPARLYFIIEFQGFRSFRERNIVIEFALRIFSVPHGFHHFTDKYRSGG